MTGILCIDKPAGLTSFDVVARVRRMTGIRKVGHGGTLDPMATGVLPVFIGRATKLCDILPIQDKGYRASFRLGLSTDTQDITGKVLLRHEVSVGLEEVRGVLPRFTGEIEQIPPMYSAIKIEGQKLYDLARKGVEVERQPRKILISSLTLERADAARNEYTIQVTCSKGTYIRTLCHDIGRALGCGATLTKLRRTQACGFALDDCLTLEAAQELADAEELEARLLPCESVFGNIPRLDLTDRQAFYFCNGVRLTLEGLSLQGDEEQVAVFHDGSFLGTAQVLEVESEKRLKLQKLFELEASH